MPVGFSKVTIGYPRVGTNCALCHTARWRVRPTAPSTIVPAGPAHQTGVQEYRRFLIACASDERFNAATILGEIAKNYRLSLLDRLLYRFLIIPSTRRRLLALERDGQWMHARTDWGRGRADVVNDVKFSLLRRPADNTVGTADNVPLWNLGARDGKALFWDGSNSSLKESVLASALAMGVSAGPARRCPIEPRATAELHQRGSAAGVSVCGRREGGAAGPGGLRQAHAQGATHPADPAPAPSYRSRSLAPIDIASMHGRRTMRTRSTPSATGAIGSSRHSGNQTVMSRFRSMACGCARPIFTTGPCRRWLTSSSLPSAVRASSGADTTCTIPRTWDSYRRDRRPAGSGPCTTSPSPATATPATCTGQSFRSESKRVLLEFLKTQ